MAESYNGLRFDIFERVHLPEEVAAIEELEEIELVPHMQALPMDDQILLRGHLLLTGSYHSQEERSVTRQLEHWIPVEISLPLGRVERLEDLAIEIDNFDVDLLSTRSLNVTGVLGLKGLHVSAPQAPVWQEDTFTVVHQAPPEVPESYVQRYEEGQNEPGAYPSPDYSWFESYGKREENQVHNSPTPYEGPSAYLPQIEQQEPEPGPRPGPYYSNEQAPPYQPVQQQPVQQQPAPFSYRPPEHQPEREPYGNAGYVEQPWGDVTGERLEQVEQAAKAVPETQAAKAVPETQAVKAVPETQAVKAVPEKQAVPEAQAVLAEPAVPESAAEPVQATPPPAPVAEEKPELKVALNTKPPEPSPSYSLGGVGLLSQLGEKGAKREAEHRQAEEAANADQAALASAAAPSASSSESSGDEVEWTRLFLSKSGAANTFRKFKLCIVQREDTLDAIASRYNVQVRELQLHNRLLEPHVTEGQILYIP